MTVDRMAATPDQGASKTEINKRVQARYNALIQEGKHGHYETMFRVVHEERAAAASEARAAELERLGFGKIVMMSEQRNRPGLPPRWCALARGSKVAAMGDSEEEARLLALATPAQPEGK